MTIAEQQQWLMAQFAKHTSWVPYIEQALAAVPYPQKPEGLYEPIEYVLSMGGKRLRPTLLLMTYGLYNDDINHATPAAVGIETYHNHTLLHDDLMDHADMRRGKPTVHKSGTTTRLCSRATPCSSWPSATSCNASACIRPKRSTSLHARHKRFARDNSMM